MFTIGRVVLAIAFNKRLEFVPVLIEVSDHFFVAGKGVNEEQRQ